MRPLSRSVLSGISAFCLLSIHAAETTRSPIPGDGGPATQSALAYPADLSIDAAGNLYVADTGHHVVRRVTPGGRIETVAGTGEPGNGDDFSRPGLAVALRSPTGVAVAQDQHIYIVDYGNRKVRRLSPDGHELRTHLFEQAGFRPFRLSFDPKDVLFVLDRESHRIGRFISGEQFHIVLGTREPGYNGDGFVFAQNPNAGLESVRQLNTPTALAHDVFGHLIVGDSGNRLLRKVVGLERPPAQTGSIGPLLQIPSPVGAITSDHEENLFYTLVPQPDVFSDGAHRVYRLRGQQLLVVAGSGERGFSGDGGLAINARFDNPTGIAVDKDGNIYVADTNNHRIRKITKDGRISTIAGGFPEPYLDSVFSSGLSIPAQSRVAPGSIASIFGRFLNPQGGDRQLNHAGLESGGQLPRNLAGICVEVNGTRAGIFRVSASRVDFQVPAFDASPSGTELRVRARANCGSPSEFITNFQPLTGLPQAPEFFFAARNPNGINPVIAINNSRGGFVGPRGTVPGVRMEPALRGDQITLLLTGLGAAGPSVTPGRIAMQAAPVDTSVRIQLGSVTRIVPAFAGTAAHSAGLYTVTFRVPSTVSAGNLAITVQAGGDPENPNTGVRTPPGAFLAVE